ARTGERVHQRALAGIGIADERGVKMLMSRADLADLSFVDLIDLTLQKAHAARDDTPVDLNLPFTRAASTDTADRARADAAGGAGDSLQVCPHATQSR